MWVWTFRPLSWEKRLISSPQNSFLIPTDIHQGDDISTFKQTNKRPRCGFCECAESCDPHGGNPYLFDVVSVTRHYPVLDESKAEMMRQITAASVSVSTSHKLTDTQRSHFPRTVKGRQVNCSVGKKLEGPSSPDLRSAHTQFKKNKTTYKLLQITFFLLFLINYWLCCSF